MPNWFINIKSKGAKKTSKDIKGLTGNLNGMASAAKKAAVIFGVGFLGKQIFDIGKSTVKTAATFETLQVRLTALYGSVNRGAKAFENFNKVAASTPFQLQDVVDAGASLKAFGLDAEEMIKPLADLAAFMQVDMSVAASNMGRAFVAGAGAADMFREKGINQMIADMAGVMDATKLPIEQYRETLQKVLVDPKSGIVGMTTKMADTWNGAVSNFQDGADRLKAAIGEELINFLRPKLDAINEKLSELGDIGWDNIFKTMFDNSEELLDKTAKIFGIGGEIIGRSLMEAISKTIIEFAPSILQAMHDMVPSWLLVPKLLTKGYVLAGEQITDSLVDVADQSGVNADLLAQMGSIMRTSFDNIVEGAQELKDKNAETNQANLEIMAVQIEQMDFIRAKQVEGIETVAVSEHSASEAQAVAIKKNETIYNKFADSKLKWQKILSKEEIKNAALTTQTAGDAMKSVVKAESMEAIAGLISSILKNVPYPFNLFLAAGAGGVANSLIDKNLSSFAQGGDFITSGAQAIIVGDNPSGRERVQITPLDAGGEDVGGASSITLNISAPLVDETVVESIIPAIREAVRRGEDIGIS